MAKSPLDAFAKFNDILDKRVKSKVEIRGFSDIEEYISTGNYLLNAQMSGSLFGGYPNTRSIGIAGDSGSGKTFLCLNAVRELQKAGYYVFYIDTEGAIDSTDYIKFGVDLEKLRYLRMGLISEVKFFVNDLIDTIKENPGLKLAVFVDSVGMLDTDKSKSDMDKGKNAADMGLRSKEMRALFKSFTLDLSNYKVPFIFTNHTYASMDQYTPKGMSGGGGPEFSASIILMLSKGTLRDEAKTTTGIIVRSKTKKNRLAKPIDIEFHISFHKGMNQFVGLENYATWEACKVGRGNLITQKEYDKMKPAEQEDCTQFELKGEICYFQPKKLGKSYINGFTGEAIPVREFFSARLFSEEVLRALDESIIKPTFKYPETQSGIDSLEIDELEDLTDFADEL